MSEYENHNPDVLSCLASLSNDEVFTPPGIANAMLDMLPSEIWSDPNIKFLDPCCKSGVFLREIMKRLLEGLKTKIPDLQERINHICKNQLYGIAITELTALLSRRSLYCSKHASGEYSICTGEFSEQGNIQFEPMKHTWSINNCIYCGANRTNFDRPDELESHAYKFIHISNPKELFKMKFDVIVGNPPYQLSDGGNKASAKPIYHLFVEQALKMNPRFVSMIIPSRWFAGGKGLDEFRDKMLNDNRLRILHDYFDSNDCFPGVDISGGVCYFLWDRDNPGLCDIFNHSNSKVDELARPLLEDNCDSFIRFNKAISIIRKVKEKNEPTFDLHVSSRKPFGISTDTPVLPNQMPDTIPIYAYPDDGFIHKNLITQGKDVLDKYKVLISYAYGERGQFPYLILGKPFIGMPGHCCSETYIILDSFDNLEQSNNLISYLKTKFFRFMVLMKKNTQHATRSVYSLVPDQDYSKEWTDDDLYQKYNLDDEEIDFIDSLIRPME